MKIAELTILENLSSVQFTELLSDQNVKISIGIRDNLGKEIVLDIKPFFLSESKESVFLKETIDFADYHLYKENVMFLISPEGNNFKLKACKLIDKNDTTEVIDSHKVLLKISTNTGNIVGKIIDTKEFIIDVSKDILDDVKTELAQVNLELIGTKWNDFTINGKSKIELHKIEEETVFVGNKIEGFLTI